jgi:solute carrier family 35, member F5
MESPPWMAPSYGIGLCFIACVSVIWAASSVLIQYLYNDTHNTFHSPFMVTYIGVSLFTLWLPAKKFSLLLQRFTTESVPYESVLNSSYSEDATSSELMEANHQLRTSLQDEEENDFEVLSESTEPRPWTEGDHFRTAICIAPVWFVANWTYNASLVYTSVTSSTVLASTGSLFTFLFAVLTHDEDFRAIKLLGVVLGVLGSLFTTLNDSSSAPNDDALQSASSARFWGDVLGLISAIGYGMYAVQTRVYCPNDESLYSMSTLLGYIGLCNFLVLSPVALYLLLSGTATLTWTVVGFLTIKGLFDNVLSDYLWLRAVILTNATTATVGLGLTIPLAFASDLVMGKDGVLSTEQVVGALTVLVGFVLVNLGNRDAANAIDHHDAIAHPDLDTSMSALENASQRGQEIVNLRTRDGIS